MEQPAQPTPLRSIYEEVYIIGGLKTDHNCTPVKVKITKIAYTQTSFVSQIYYYFEVLNKEDKKYFPYQDYVEFNQTFNSAEECKAGIKDYYKSLIEKTVGHLNNKKQELERLKTAQSDLEKIISKLTESIEQMKALVKQE